MSKAESNFSNSQKFELRMSSKKEQVQKIREELTNFKNEKFKTRVAEFLCWINLVLNQTELFSNHFPSDLKNYLAPVKRYENDVIIMTEDVNRRFKKISLTRDLPHK